MQLEEANRYPISFQLEWGSSVWSLLWYEFTVDAAEHHVLSCVVLCGAAAAAD